MKVFVSHIPLPNCQEEFIYNFVKCVAVNTYFTEEREADLAIQDALTHFTMIFRDESRIPIDFAEVNKKGEIYFTFSRGF